jgi:hypothetical protein
MLNLIHSWMATPGVQALVERVRREEGQGLTEYILVLSAVVLVVAAAVSFTGLGTALQGIVDDVIAAL